MDATNPTPRGNEGRERGNADTGRCEHVQYIASARALVKQIIVYAGMPGGRRCIDIGSRTLIPTSAAMRWLDKQIQP